VLELIEEALDEVAFAIERKVARALGLTVGLGWNDRSNPPLGEGVDERVSIICLVANQGIWVGFLDQWPGTSKIMSLAWSKHQLDGIAQGIDDGMMVWTAPTASIVPE